METREIYYANSSIIVKKNRVFKNSKELNFQWIFDTEVGQTLNNRMIWRMTNRFRDYHKGIHDTDVDAEWAPHLDIVNRAWRAKKELKLPTWIGKARPHKILNKRALYTCALLTFHEDLNQYNLEVWMGKWHLKMPLDAQQNPIYPYRGEYRNDDIDTNTGAVTLW